MATDRCFLESLSSPPAYSALGLLHSSHFLDRVSPSALKQHVISHRPYSAAYYRKYRGSVHYRQCTRRFLRCQPKPPRSGRDTSLLAVLGSLHISYPHSELVAAEDPRFFSAFPSQNGTQQNRRKHELQVLARQPKKSRSFLWRTVDRRSDSDWPRRWRRRNYVREGKTEREREGGERRITRYEQTYCCRLCFPSE